jgi:peptidoglycan hydrolase-like protein with peptidoglycan-binding domain
MGWLIRGSRGDNVRRIQGLLWQAGLYDGAIDGRYGRLTEAAVRDWQREVGSRPDGMWGPRTQDFSAAYLGRFNEADALDAGRPAVVPYVNRTEGTDGS